MTMPKSPTPQLREEVACPWTDPDLRLIHISCPLWSSSHQKNNLIRSVQTFSHSTPTSRTDTTCRRRKGADILST